MKKFLAGLAILAAAVFCYADSSTTRAGLTIIDVGGSGWGPKINANYQTMDSSAAWQSTSNTFSSTNTFTQPIVINGAQPLRFGDSSTHYIGFQASGTVTTTDFTLPAADGAAGSFIQTDGSKNLYFGALSSSMLPAGSTNYIHNQSTLQAGSTSYSDYLHVGSSASVEGPGGLRVGYGATVGSMTVNGTAAISGSIIQPLTVASSTTITGNVALMGSVSQPLTVTSSTTLTGNIALIGTITQPLTSSSSMTVTAAVRLGAAASAVFISSNAVLPGATFYQNGLATIANIRVSSFTMDSPLNLSDQTGISLWTDTSNTFLGESINPGRGSAFTQNTVGGAGAFNTAGGFNGKSWQGNTIWGYTSAALFGATGQNVYFNTCVGALSCGGSTGGGAGTDDARNSALGYSALGGNAFSAGTTCNTALGDNAGFAQVGSSNTFLGAETTQSATTNNCTAIGAGASCTTSNSIVMGSAVPAVTVKMAMVNVSSNVVTPGATFYQNGLTTIANVRVSSFTMDSPLNLSDQTGINLWTDTSNTSLGGSITPGRGSAFTQNTVVGYGSFNWGGGLNGKTWQNNALFGYKSFQLAGNNGQNVQNDTCIGALTCGGTSGSGTGDQVRLTAVGTSALGGTAIGTSYVSNTALGDSAGTNQAGSSNTYVGAATTQSGSVSNCSAIGYGASCMLSNSVVLGSLTPLVTTLSGPIQISTAMGTGYMVAISSFGHFNVFPTSPTISSCGTTPNGRVTGSDIAGTITVGGGAVTACTLTFVNAWRNTPVCVVTDNSASISVGLTSVSTTAFTVGTSLSLGGGNIYYHCFGVE